MWLLVMQKYVNETDMSAWSKVPLLQKAGPCDVGVGSGRWVAGGRAGRRL